ncbi:MAG TPA: nitroreductase [Balneolaceae bacterium]|nr:nitroreductase [Balneolaceae bacterium]
MHKKAFELLETIVNNRRTTKAHAMNGELIDNDKIQKLLLLADQAPNHGQTEPWRFMIFSGKALDDFGQTHADIYWAHTEPNKRRKSKYKKYIRYAQNASHVVAAVMRPGSNTNIPEKEERSAVSAAIQNMLLGATALGIASFWSTGGMSYHPEFKKYLGLKEGDKMIGILYLGHTDQLRKKKKRRIPLEEKIIWAEEAVAV